MADINFGNFTDRHNFNFGDTQVEAIEFGGTRIWTNNVQITSFTSPNTSLANTARTVNFNVVGGDNAVFTISSSLGATRQFIIGGTLSGYTTVTSGVNFSAGPGFITSNNDAGDPARNITFTLAGATVSGFPPVVLSGINPITLRQDGGPATATFSYNPSNLGTRTGLSPGGTPQSDEYRGEVELTITNNLGESADVVVTGVGAQNDGSGAEWINGSYINGNVFGTVPARSSRTFTIRAARVGIAAGGTSASIGFTVNGRYTAVYSVTT